MSLGGGSEREVLAELKVSRDWRQNELGTARATKSGRGSEEAVLGDGNIIAGFVGVWFVQRVLARYLIPKYWSDAKNANGFQDILYNTKRR